MAQSNHSSDSSEASARKLLDAASKAASSLSSAASSLASLQPELSLSGQLQISNLNQVQQHLEDLTRKRVTQLEVQLTGDGADLLKNFQVSPISLPVTLQGSNSSSGSGSSSGSSSFSSWGKSTLNQLQAALAKAFNEDAGEGKMLPSGMARCSLVATRNERFLKAQGTA